MGFTITRDGGIVKEKLVVHQRNKILLFRGIYAKIVGALSEERDETGGRGQA